MRITPLNNQILLQEVKDELKSGIIIPEPLNKDKQVQKGLVVAWAAGQYDNSTEPIKKHSTVLFNGYAASEITIDNKKHFLIDAEEILGIYEL